MPRSQKKTLSRRVIAQSLRHNPLISIPNLSIPAPLLYLHFLTRANPQATRSLRAFATPHLVEIPVPEFP